MTSETVQPKMSSERDLGVIVTTVQIIVTGAAPVQNNLTALPEHNMSAQAKVSSSVQKTKTGRKNPLL